MRRILLSYVLIYFLNFDLFNFNSLFLIVTPLHAPIIYPLLLRFLLSFSKLELKIKKLL